MVGLLAVLLVSKGGGDLYANFAAKLRSATAMSGRVTSTVITPDKTTSYSWIFTCQRPNLWRFEGWEGKQYRMLEVSDGKSLWILDAVRNLLTKQQTLPVGTGISFVELEPFLYPSPSDKEYLKLKSPEGKPARFHGHNAVEYVFGYRYKDSAGTPAGNDVSDLHLFMDPKTGLPLGSIKNPQKVRLEFAFNDLKLNPTIEPSMFKFESKVAVNNSPLLEDYLLPLESKAPPFRGRMLGNKPFELATALKGAKAVVLDFWGPGCPACLEEMPVFDDLSRKYGAKGLKILSVYMSDRTRSGLDDFVKARRMNLPIVLGNTCEPDLVFGYKVTLVPVTYLLDSKGVIVGSYDSTHISKLKTDLLKMGF